MRRKERETGGEICGDPDQLCSKNFELWPMATPPTVVYEYDRHVQVFNVKRTSKALLLAIRVSLKRDI